MVVSLSALHNQMYCALAVTSATLHTPASVCIYYIYIEKDKEFVCACTSVKYTLALINSGITKVSLSASEELEKTFDKPHKRGLFRNVS